MGTAQCGSMEAEVLSFVLRAAGGSIRAEALSFVLRAAGSEHHQSSTRRVFTYVVGGRVGMNDTCVGGRVVYTCYFSLDAIPCDVCPKCRITHVCKRKRTSSSPPHPTLSHVMCGQSVESHMCASAKERHHPHPTRPYPM